MMPLNAVERINHSRILLSSSYVDPDMMQSRIAAMAGLDDEDNGYREKRKEALGKFILAPFRPSNGPQVDFINLAHRFFELVPSPSF